MSWESIYKYNYFPYRDNYSSISPIRINEQCLIRKQHECGKLFNASKSCFIACPTDLSLEPILELMSEKLTKNRIEPIIAVKERAYGQDIFCTKICGKIIESSFCVVILDDTIQKDINIPNPNVYYEYGLMTSLRKHIIPLQKEGLNLAFNIQSHDTIKYNAGNIGPELDRAIKDAIRITESQEKEEEDNLAESTIMRKLELNGFQLKKESWFLNDVIEDTLFKGFGHDEKRFYLYLGKIDSLDDFQIYLEDLGVVIYRTEKKVKELENKLIKIKEEETGNELNEKETKYSDIRSLTHARKINRSGDKIEIESRKQLMDTIYIGFIINSQLDRKEFITKVNELVKDNKRFLVKYNKNDEIEFGDIKISLSFNQHQ